MSPGWLRLAWESISPSLEIVVRAMQDEKAADTLVYSAFLTSGRRALLEMGAVIEWAEERA